jgi:protein subunit release factor B
MKIRHAIIASAALAFGPAALAQEAPQGTSDCATLQAQFDQHAAAATAEQLSQAKAARDEGEKLCSEGKTAEGAAKLKEAISQIASPTQQPSS